MVVNSTKTAVQLVWVENGNENILDTMANLDGGKITVKYHRVETSITPRFQ